MDVKKKSLVNGANPCNVFQFFAHVELSDLEKLLLL